MSWLLFLYWNERVLRNVIWFGTGLLIRVYITYLQQIYLDTWATDTILFLSPLVTDCIMRHLLWVLIILPAFLGCDSNDSAPELSINLSSPTEQTIVNRGEPFQLEIDITSALDLRDLDVQISPRMVGERAEYIGRNLRIEQGPELTQFFVDTTLFMPMFEGLEGGDYLMMLLSPSGTTNILKLVEIKVD